MDNAQGRNHSDLARSYHKPLLNDGLQRLPPLLPHHRQSLPLQRHVHVQRRPRHDPRHKRMPQSWRAFKDSRVLLQFAGEVVIFYFVIRITPSRPNLHASARRNPLRNHDIVLRMRNHNHLIRILLYTEPWHNE